MIKYRVFDKRLNSYHGNSGITSLVENGVWSLKVEDNQVLELFTGLQDKNGVDIYVGDILKREDGRISSVVFEDGELTLYEDGTSLYWLIERVKNNIEEVFIIGNINENKELLE